MTPFIQLPVTAMLLTLLIEPKLSLPIFYTFYGFIFVVWAGMLLAQKVTSLLQTSAEVGSCDGAGKIIVFLKLQSLLGALFFAAAHHSRSLVLGGLGCVLGGLFCAFILLIFLQQEI